MIVKMSFVIDIDLLMISEYSDPYLINFDTFVKSILGPDGWRIKNLRQRPSLHSEK